MAIVVGLLAVLAVFGGAIVLVSSTQHMGAALDLQGVRAYYAARAGLEWGIYHVLRPDFAGCAGIDSRSMTYDGNLAGFRVTLQCTETVHDEGGMARRMYALTATACNDAVCPTPASPPAPAYVERQLSVVLGSD